jgi:hypothetical protein
LVARADFMFASDANRYVAAVFMLLLVSAPEHIESDELTSFAWWDPSSEMWDGVSPLDAPVVRRCRSHE